MSVTTATKRKKVESVAEPKPLRLDFGCGKNKREGFTGIDLIHFDGVDVVHDLATLRWPWEDDSVDEGHTSHFLEHLEPMQRVHFANELYRVLKPGAKCQVICPHWSSCRAYGDPTHKWPGVSEFWFYYLSREWRSTNAPHTDAENLIGGFNCDFEATWGYSFHPYFHTRSQETQQFAMQFYRDALQDIMGTLVKRVSKT